MKSFLKSITFDESHIIKMSNQRILSGLYVSTLILIGILVSYFIKAKFHADRIKEIISSIKQDEITQEKLEYIQDLAINHITTVESLYLGLGFFIFIFGLARTLLLFRIKEIASLKNIEECDR